MNSKPAIKTTLKFIVMSLIGILYFFVPLVPSDKGKGVLLVYSVNIIKSALFSLAFRTGHDINRKPDSFVYHCPAYR